MQKFTEKPTSKFFLKKGTRKAKETWIEEQCQCLEEKQQQESLPVCERTDKLRTTEKYYHPGQSREMTQRRTRHSKEVDRVMFWIVNTHNSRRSQGARCPSTNQQWQLPYPAGRSWSGSKITVNKRILACRAGVDYIPSELVQTGGEAMIDMLLIICNKI